MEKTMGFEELFPKKELCENAEYSGVHIPSIFSWTKIKTFGIDKTIWTILKTKDAELTDAEIDWDLRKFYVLNYYAAPTISEIIEYVKEKYHKSAEEIIFNNEKIFDVNGFFSYIIKYIISGKRID